VPVAATENVAVCPAVTLWLSGWVVMASAVVPVPLREIASGESVSLLAVVIVPEALPGPVGAYRTRKA